MAKKQDMSDIFAKTESGDLDSDQAQFLDRLEAGNIKATGVGLRQGEVDVLDEIAGELEVSRNALLRYAVRWFLIEYQAGNVDLAESVVTPPPPKKRLKLPGQ